MFNSGKYHFKWYHDNKHSTNFLAVGKMSRKSIVKPKPSVTTCEIWEANQLISTGSAICQVEDNFSRKIGRKLSLNRALQNGVPKEEREAIWKDYFEVWPPNK